MPAGLGLEGIVSKRRDSFYSSGRSPDWIKSKNPDAPAGRPKKTGAVETSTGYFLPQRAAGPIKAGRWTERSSCRCSVSSRALASLPLGQSAIHGLSRSSHQRPRGRFLWLSIGQCRPIEISAPAAAVESPLAIHRLLGMSPLACRGLFRPVGSQSRNKNVQKL
jgi:hypothetical protein